MSSSLHPALSIRMALLLLAGMTPIVRAETPEELLTRLESKFKDFKTISLTSKMSMQSPMGQVEAITQTKLLHVGELVKSRLEREMKRTDSAGLTVNTTSLMINDGQFLWSQDQKDEVITVTKRNAPLQPPLDYSQIRERLATAQVTIKEPEEINGEQCAVLEMAAVGPQPSTTTYWFSETSGMMLKLVSTGAMSSTTTLQIENLVIDSPLEESLFSYAPPEGVEVQDLTVSKITTAPAPDTQPTTETQPAGEKETEPESRPASAPSGD